jgi:hypothetical protein
MLTGYHVQNYFRLSHYPHYPVCQHRHRLSHTSHLSLLPFLRVLLHRSALSAASQKACKIEINRSLISLRSSSLITECNPLYRHLKNTHVYSLQAKNTFSRRMHKVQKPNMRIHNIRHVDPAHIQKFKYVICSFVHRLSSKASSES